MATAIIKNGNYAAETSSMTAVKQNSRQNEIEQMKADLSRYTRSNDRRMVLRSLREVKALAYVQLEGSLDFPDVPTSELEKEVSDETIKLNSFTFRPKGSGVVPRKDVIATAGFHSGPTIMLQGLLEELCGSKDVTADSQVLYKQILARTARSSGSADAYFQLNSMLGSSDLMVMQLPSGTKYSDIKNGTPPSYPSNGSNHDSDDKKSKPISSTDSVVDNEFIQLNIYQQHGQIHITLDIAFDFGLFRKSDVKPNRPWIALQAVVHERANLSSGESVRSMRVQLPDLY